MVIERTLSTEYLVRVTIVVLGTEHVTKLWQQTYTLCVECIREASVYLLVKQLILMANYILYVFLSCNNCSHDTHTQYVILNHKIV